MHESVYQAEIGRLEREIENLRKQLRDEQDRHTQTGNRLNVMGTDLTLAKREVERLQATEADLKALRQAAEPALKHYVVCVNRLRMQGEDVAYQRADRLMEALGLTARDVRV